MEYLKAVLLLESMIPKKNLIDISKGKIIKKLFKRAEILDRIR